MADPDLVTMNYYVNISVMIFCRNYRSKALNEINTTISWPGFTTASAQSTGISEILVTVHKGFIASPLFFIYIYFQVIRSDSLLTAGLERPVSTSLLFCCQEYQQQCNCPITIDWLYKYIKVSLGLTKCQ